MEGGGGGESTELIEKKQTNKGKKKRFMGTGLTPKQYVAKGHGNLFD